MLVIDYKVTFAKDFDTKTKINSAQNNNETVIISTIQIISL